MSTEMFAQYFSNVFQIELSEKVNIFNKVNNEEISDHDYSIFVHEYWHYLLNFSTFGRIRDFSLYYNLFPIFSQTLTFEQNGEADTKILKADDYKLLEEVTDLIEAYSYSGFEKGGGIIVDFKVLSEVLSEDKNLILNDKQIPFTRGKVKVEVTTDKEVYEDFYYIGNDCIDESIANCIERMICRDGSQNHLAPYYVLSKISEFFNNGIALNYYELACIGTLSLMSSNSGASLNWLLRDYINYKTYNSIDDSIEIICDRFKPIFMNTTSSMIDQMDEILRVFENRSPAVQAIEFIKEKMEMAIVFRKKSLLFELKPFRSDCVDKKLLSTLISTTFKPCAVMQKRAGDPLAIKKDVMLVFENDTIIIDGKSVPKSFLMQVMHCQLSYFKAHWSMHFLMDSRLAKNECPYFTVCNLKCRVENPSICLETPWKTFLIDGEKCAYGLAVATLISQTKFL